MEHKKDWGPGYRFFTCECGHKFKEASRHCESPSLDVCPQCREEVFPEGFERHYEWPTDNNGNLYKPDGVAYLMSKSAKAKGAKTITVEEFLNKPM